MPKPSFTTENSTPKSEQDSTYDVHVSMMHSGLFSIRNAAQDAIKESSDPQHVDSVIGGVRDWLKLINGLKTYSRLIKDQTPGRQYSDKEKDIRAAEKKFTALIENEPDKAGVKSFISWMAGETPKKSKGLFESPREKEVTPWGNYQSSRSSSPSEGSFSFPTPTPSPTPSQTNIDISDLVNKSIKVANRSAAWEIIKNDRDNKLENREVVREAHSTATNNLRISFSKEESHKLQKFVEEHGFEKTINHFKQANSQHESPLHFVMEAYYAAKKTNPLPASSTQQQQSQSSSTILSPIPSRMGSGININGFSGVWSSTTPSSTTMRGGIAVPARDRGIK